MIVGLGVDITEVDRMEAAIARRGRALLERLFTPAEIATAKSTATAPSASPGASPPRKRR